jgi:hypothetical protein
MSEFCMKCYEGIFPHEDCKAKPSTPSAPQAAKPETQYRKRPLIITAKQWFKAGDHLAVLTPPRMCIKSSDMRCVHCGESSGKHGEIVTLESGDGYQLVCPGDWIIKGIKGEFYPCKPDVFTQTYEPASPSSSTERDELVEAAEGAVVAWHSSPQAEGCPHDIPADIICDGCKYIWEKRMFGAIEKLRRALAQEESDV